MRARKRSLFIGIAAIYASLHPKPARADEPPLANEPRMLEETAEITSVVDAFDKGDPFDLHLRVGFEQTWKHSAIRRETQLAQPGMATGGFIPANENIANYSRQISTLHLGADIGIYQDLALLFRLPVILSDSQKLTDLNGSQAVSDIRLADPTSPGTPLFKMPFTSPTRSGLDWLGIGLDWGIFNQRRDASKPTWIVGIEARVGVGTPLAACSSAAPCPNPAHEVSSGAAATIDQGMSRATTALRFHTIASKRINYVEPYIGFWFQAEIPQMRGGSSAWAQGSGAPGVLLNIPPLQGTVGTGVEIVPFERKEQFQRLSADFRILGTYHSPGREYTELFDALGSSSAPSLTTPNPYQYSQNGTPDPRKVPFTGLTDQNAYASAGASVSMTWQAGEYIKFQAGLGFQYDQSHLITAADPCNPSFSGTAGSGPCVNPTNPSSLTGIPNPNHYTVIDTPGHRFAAEDTTLVNLWLMGVVMF